MTLGTVEPSCFASWDTFHRMNAHGDTATRTGVATPSCCAPVTVTIDNESAVIAPAPSRRARNVTVATMPEPDAPVDRVNLARARPDSRLRSTPTAEPSR